MATTAPIVLDDDALDGVLGTSDQQPVNDTAPLDLLAQIAQTEGDISHLLDEQTLTTLGADVVRDYERDLGDREPWEKIVRDALKRAAQEKIEVKDAEPYRRSFVNYPILTVAAQQFNARAYPAICKSGEMVKVRVIGSDNGRPQIGQDGQPVMEPVPGAAAPAPSPQAPPDAQQAPQASVAPPMQPVWAIPPGAKIKRANRVSDYMNVYLEYRMDDWEEDTDLLLYQIAIVGCGFRKLWWSEGKQCAAYVPALDLIVPVSAKSLKTTPRTTERVPDVYPYQIRQRQASGEYRAVDLPQIGEDEESPRLLLEQHRLVDLDGDGLGEPYIVTVDKETSQVLKIEANFSPDDIKLVKGDEAPRVAKIEKRRFYVKYPFLPDPNGGFYDIGFGHLLSQMGDIINTTINQMFDAGHAQIAGGGFIASGLRLQGNGQSNTIRWAPGEYKNVNVTGQDLRAGIVERTFPGVSPIMFQLLELVLGAAKDITSVKDVVTGDAPNTAPVGTTMALIEQGLQVFTAIYKRVYRSLGEEFGLIYDNLALYGDEETAADYQTVLDDPVADFAKDFGEKDMDIKPVADPSSVTKMQRIAKAQVLLGMRGQGLNDMEIDRRALEAMDIEDIDKLLPYPNAPPNPAAVAELEKTQSETQKNLAQADYFKTQGASKAVETGLKLGEADGEGDTGGLPHMAPVAGLPMGNGGPGGQGGGPAGGMEGGIVGAGAI